MSDTRQKDVIGCPRCKTAMEEVARIKPLQKVQGLIPLMSALPADTRLAKYCRRAGAGLRNNMALKLLRPDSAPGSTRIAVGCMSAVHATCG